MKGKKLSLDKTRMLGFRLIASQNQNPEKIHAVQLNAKIGNSKNPDN